MNITIGSDHGAVALKDEVKMVLKEYEDIKVTHVGTLPTRSALFTYVYSAKKAREHNNANVLAMGGRVLGFGPAGEIVRAFVESSFEGGRHARRVNKIMAIEQQ